MTGQQDSHRIRLGPTRWWVRREFVLRGAGFPTTLAERLCDGELTRTAEDDLPAVYDRAAERTLHTMRELAAEPRLREAIAWQSPAVLRNCLDKVASGRELPGKVRRQNDLTIANYVQRYAAKNDTIGFFGPAAWASWRADQPDVLARPGDDVVSRRQVFFEYWAIDAVADAFAADPAVLKWLRPIVSENHSLLDGALRDARGALSQWDGRRLVVLELCDGQRTVEQIVAGLAGSRGGGFSSPEDVLAELRALAGLGAVRLGLTGPVTAYPEITLRRKLSDISDAAVAGPAVAVLDELIEARDTVARAAGDADKLTVALDEMNEVFHRITGVEATRRGGEMYAGRTLVYEDTVRDIDLDFGATVLDALSRPLGMVLDSARWLVSEAAAVYDARFAELYDKLSNRLGTPDVPLASLVGSAAPDLAFSFHEPSPLLTGLIDELRRRWARVLCVPDGVRRHTVSADEIAARVAREFPSTAPRWAAAVHHSPDIMIASSGVEHINRGDFQLVLGEVHVGMNTLVARPLVEFHTDPDRLLAADEADYAFGRIFLVPTKESRLVTSRTYPSALLSPQYLYWAMHADITGAPGPVVASADLTVRRDGDRLVVVSRRDEKSAYDLLAVIGEYLSPAVANTFSPVAGGEHRPRVSIDRLVLTRESWTFPIDEVTWPSVKDERERHLRAEQWRRENGLPRRAFYRVFGEDKPMFVDFAGIAFTSLFARTIRKAVRDGEAGTVTLTEMLPDLEDSWLRDNRGNRYTAEVRLLCVDPDVADRKWP